MHLEYELRYNLHTKNLAKTRPGRVLCLQCYSRVYYRNLFDKRRQWQKANRSVYVLGVEWRQLSVCDYDKYERHCGVYCRIRMLLLLLRRRRRLWLCRSQWCNDALHQWLMLSESCVHSAAARPPSAAIPWLVATQQSRLHRVAPKK